MLSDTKFFKNAKNKTQVDEMLLLKPLLECMYKENIINKSTYLKAKKEVEKNGTSTTILQ
jgi:uncharacterized protein YqgQ